MAGFETVQKRVQELRSLLNYHSKRYYEEDAPEIEDYEYDQMLRELGGDWSRSTRSSSRRIRRPGALAVGQIASLRL